MTVNLRNILNPTNMPIHVKQIGSFLGKTVKSHSLPIFLTISAVAIFVLTKYYQSSNSQENKPMDLDLDAKKTKTPKKPKKVSEIKKAVVWDANGRTPLSAAVISGDLNEVRRLVEVAGVDINAADKAEDEFSEIPYDVLCPSDLRSPEHGFVKHPLSVQRTPLDHAALNGKFEMVNYLVEKGANVFVCPDKVHDIPHLIKLLLLQNDSSGLKSCLNFITYQRETQRKN